MGSSHPGSAQRLAVPSTNATPIAGSGSAEWRYPTLKATEAARSHPNATAPLDLT
jgi:hypothetical protein